MGVGHLPDDGGTMDQPVIMLDAFSLMSGFEAKLNEKDGPPVNDDGEIDHAEIGRRVAARLGVAI